MDGIVIEPLTPEHRVDGFDCHTGHEEDADLNDFIKNDALNEKYEGWNKTYVAVSAGTKDVLGFFTISNDSFQVKPDVKSSKHKPYFQVPATKIGRLAVDKRYQQKGLGKFLVRYAIGFVVDQICRHTGCRYITLDAYPYRVGWYLKNFPFRVNTFAVSAVGTGCVNIILALKDFPERLAKNE